MSFILGAIFWCVFGGIVLIGLSIVGFLVLQLINSFHWTVEQSLAFFGGMAAGAVAYKAMKNRRG